MLGETFDEVLTAARAGGGWAATRLYDDLAAVVHGYVRQQGADEPEDVTSETFLQVFRDLDRFDGDEVGFRSWVFTIAHRRMLDARRRTNRQPATASLEAAMDPEGDEAAVDAMVASSAWVDEQLAVLTPTQRDVVLLRIVGGFSVAETSAILGRRPAAVRQMQRRGLRAVAEALGHDAGGI